MCGRYTWCLVKFYIILTAKKMPLWFVAVENKTFALWKWKAFPCLQGVLCQTLSQLEKLHPECERLRWSICLFASCAVCCRLCSLSCTVLGIAEEHHILDRFCNKNMIVNVSKKISMKCWAYQFKITSWYLNWKWEMQTWLAPNDHFFILVCNLT